MHSKCMIIVIFQRKVFLNRNDLSSLLLSKPYGRVHMAIGYHSFFDTDVGVRTENAKLEGKHLSDKMKFTHIK